MSVLELILMIIVAPFILFIGCLIPGLLSGLFWGGIMVIIDLIKSIICKFIKIRKFN
jgi:hypothetical protein